MMPSFFKATVVIAVMWAVFLGGLLLRAGRPQAMRWVIVWSVLGVPVVALLLDLSRDQTHAFLGGVLGWVWGLGYAWFVRRRLRPAGAREREVPIEGWRKPWDLARIAFGLAIAAPLLGPISAGLLSGAFD